MKKFHVGVTDDVGCGAELPMWEGLSWAEISSGARVVGKYDLGIQSALKARVIDGVGLNAT